MTVAEQRMSAFLRELETSLLPAVFYLTALSRFSTTEPQPQWLMPNLQRRTPDFTDTRLALQYLSENEPKYLLSDLPKFIVDSCDGLDFTEFEKRIKAYYERKPDPKLCREIGFTPKAERP